jgi:hypothetical protein
MSVVLLASGFIQISWRDLIIIGISFLAVLDIGFLRPGHGGMLVLTAMSPPRNKSLRVE